jgi:signal transduction histidine kinase
LALVQRIVKLHSGQIKVRSHQDEPHGTVFTVRLPVKK